MAIIIPPFPVNAPVGGYVERRWFQYVASILTSAAAIAWNGIDFTNSKLADLAQRLHSDLQSLQGGTTNEYFHQTQTKYVEQNTISSTTTNVTLDATYGILLVDASSGNKTITVPTASTFTNRRFIVKKIDSSANTVTLTRSASNTIDGGNTYVLTTQWQFTTIVSDGTNWYRI